MVDSYWSGRSRRELPQVNYNESSDEEDFNSPLASPSRPPVTRAGSPVELAIPTLNDNVDEDLEAVRQTLNNVGHTHTFRGTRPDPEGGVQQPGELVSIPAGHADGNGSIGEEEVVEGYVVEEGVNLKVGVGDNGSEDGSEDGNNSA